MNTKLGLAFFSLVACAVMACSADKADSVDPDGGSRTDTRLPDSGVLNPEAGRTDGQTTVTPDARIIDAPAQPALDGPAPDGPSLGQDGQAPDSAADLVADRSPTESGAGPDGRLGVDGADSAIDAPAITDAPAADGGTDDVLADTLPAATPDAVAQCGRIKCDCTYKGKKLWGRVQYVTSFPDFKVRVSSFPDLKVNETLFARSCGEWEKVTAFPDFKVQIVESFEDFSIAYSVFPGVP